MSVITEFIENIVFKGLEHFGRYYSKYRAIVYDTEDPENLSRLRLVIPGISDNPSAIWAHPSNQFSGPNFGSHVIPPIGSMIWVEFEHGDPEEPIWSFGHFGNNEITEQRLLKTKNFWFGTPGGYLIELNDELEELRITDPFKNEIHLNEKGFSVKVGKGKKINLGDIDKAKYSAVAGEELVSIIKEILTEIASIKVLSRGTPTSIPINSAAFASIKTRLNKLLSKTNRLE